MKPQTILIASLAVLSIAGIGFAGISASQGKTTALVPVVRGGSMQDGVTGSATELILAGNEAGDGQFQGQQGGGQGQVGGGQAGPRGQQGQPGGPPQGGQMRMPANPPMSLLMDPKVKAELKLTDDQIKKIQEELKAVLPQGGPGGPPPGEGGVGGGQRQQGGQGQGQGGVGGGQRQQGGGGQGQGGVGGGQRQQGGGGQGQGGGGQMRGQDPELMAKVDGVLKANMNEQQFNRYKQLELQSNGVRAFMNPQVVEKLGLSEEQVGKIREIVRGQRRGPGGPPEGGEAGGFGGGQRQQGGGQGQGQQGGGQRQGSGQGQQGQGGFGGGQGQPPTPPNAEEMKKQEAELYAKVMAVLTESQRSKWNSMIGAKFEFSPRPAQQRGGPGGQLGGPGGGGRGGNGGGGNGGDGGNTEQVSLVF